MMEVDCRHQDAASEYLKDFWIPLHCTLEAFLNPRALTSPVSFQDTFNLVYKCVDNGFSVRLYDDLMQVVLKHLKGLDVALLNCLTHDCGGSPELGVIRMIHMFDTCLADFIIAAKGIAATFSYLSKDLGLKHSHKSLEDVLNVMFRLEIAEHFIHDILSCVERSPPFTFEPALLSRLFRNLQTISKDDYGILYSKLFARFVTDALPPMCEKDLNAHIAEVHELQAEMSREKEHLNSMRSEDSFNRNPAHKRCADDSN